VRLGRHLLRGLAAALVLAAAAPGARAAARAGAPAVTGLQQLRVAGAVDVVAGSQVLHAATPGWDHCTGRGTPDIAAFVGAA
jgi:hypothetical protein